MLKMDKLNQSVYVVHAYFINQLTAPALINNFQLPLEQLETVLTSRRG